MRTYGNGNISTKRFGRLTVVVGLWHGGVSVRGTASGLTAHERERVEEWVKSELNGWDCRVPSAAELRKILWGDS